MLNLFGRQKKIFSKRLNKMLRDISILNSRERSEVKQMLKKYQSGGLTKSEVREVIDEMKLDTSDSINRQEADAVKKKLLTFLEN